jgi:glycosyltransferase involved in cell wall biosynthesis
VKIFYVVASPSPGGIESFVKDLAIELARRDHFVHICFVESASEAKTSEDFERKYLSELKMAGVHYSFIGQSARWWPWVGIRKVRKYISQESIDVYHSHLTYGVVFGAFLSIPRVYTHHSVDMRVGRLVFTFISRWIEQLVGISEKCSQSLSTHASRTVETIFNGVDMKKFSRELTMPRTIQATVDCIAVGRICEEKNYEMLVRAIFLLPPEVRFRLAVSIVGAGPLAMTKSLEKAISDRGVGDVISLIGSRDDVPKLLESAQLFLMSSASEGLPIALIEAAASGLPCVVTDVGGCREIIERCQNGIVVEPDNPHKFAEAIEAVIGSAEKYSEYSTNALLHAKQFSIENAASLHISSYQRLLSPVPQS